MPHSGTRYVQTVPSIGAPAVEKPCRFGFFSPSMMIFAVSIISSQVFGTGRLYLSSRSLR